MAAASEVWPLRNLGTISGKKWGSNSLRWTRFDGAPSCRFTQVPFAASFQLIIAAQEQICRQKNDLRINPCLFPFCPFRDDGRHGVRPH